MQPSFNHDDMLMKPYLEHHGILGQKWGIRRYQNPDGTLTEEGKKRYYSDGRSGKVLTKAGAKAVTKDLTKLSKLRSMDKIYGNDSDDPNADRYKKKYEAERAKFKTKWGEGQDGMIDWAREHPNAEKKLDKVFSKEDALDKPIEFKSKLGQRYQRNLEIQANKAKKGHSTGNSNPMSEYSSESVTNESLLSYKSQAPQLSHVRVNKNTEGRIFSDHGKLIGMINTEKKDDSHTWIQGLELFGEGKGKGLSYRMLDYATNELGATHLSVNKQNTVAKHVYDKYGFETYLEDDNMVYMRLKSKR